MYAKNGKVRARVSTHMYWCAKIIHLELIGHFTKRLKTILAFGLLKSIYFSRLVTLLFIIHNINITESFEPKYSQSKL